MAMQKCVHRRLNHKGQAGDKIIRINIEGVVKQI